MPQKRCDMALDQTALLADFQTAIGVQFKDQGLALQVLLHPSLVGNTRAAKIGFGKKLEKYESYERLEFLGDRVLNLTMAEWLIDTYPTDTEGQIARRHTMLVKNETLNEVSKKLKIGEFVLLSSGEGLVTADLSSTSLNADVCEALLGAIFLDQGFEFVRAFVRQQWQPFFEAHYAPQIDVKTQLQEWAQERRLGLPTYTVLKQTGTAHEPEFTVQVEIQGHAPVSATGTSKKDGSIKAAAAYIKQLGIK